MGLLDHSTNNLILDAVLTDYGRRKLASNSSLGITKFALGDDEVDYTIIKKYGRAVGKEKIEKNTPVFEAFTNPLIALKYKLYSREDGVTTNSTTQLATLALTSPSGVPTIDLSNSNNGSSSVNIEVSLKYNGQTNGILDKQKQTNYNVIVPTRFCSITSDSIGSPASTVFKVDDPNLTLVYPYTVKSAVGSTSEKVSFTLTASRLDTTTLSIYGKQTGNNTGKRQIDVYVTVEASTASNISTTFKVQIIQ
jgi:hypothetical protein